MLRVESDSDGAYEAHLVTSDGNRVTVEVGSDFAVTGEEEAPTPPAGAGGAPPALPDDADGQPPAQANDAAAGGTSSGSTASTG